MTARSERETVSSKQGDNRYDGQPSSGSVPARLQIESLARLTGAVRREPRKFGCAVLLDALVAVAQSLCPSLAALAADVSLRQRQAVSKEAVQERLNDGFVALVQRVVALALGGLYRRESRTAEGLFGPFARVLVHDSTTVSLPPRLAGDFPGPRNQSGKAQAAMKLQTTFELKTDSVLGVQITPFSHNDQAASPDILAILQPGDLILRDLGYFVIDVFRRIAQRGAYFLSRLHSTAAVLDAHTGEPLDLLRLLGGRDCLDLDLLLGRSERLPVRLVAYRVPPDVAQERRRQALQNRDSRARNSARKLALLDWELFVTNVPRDQWPAQIVAQVYGFRWRIEILFKLWKSFLHLTCLTQRASRNQVTCLALARVLLAVDFQANTWQVVRYNLLRRGRHASMLKTAALFTGPSAARLRHAWRHDPEATVAILAQHCCHEKRRRISYAEAYEYYATLAIRPLPQAAITEDQNIAVQQLLP